MVPAFILAVFIHTLLLTADASRLIRQEPVVSHARSLTMRLVDRAPYSPPLIRPLPAPPPQIPAAPPKPALERPAIKPIPVVKPSKPLAKKPPEKRFPPLPPAPMPAVPEPEPESAPPPSVADPVRTAADLPPSPPYSANAVTSVDPDATPGESSSAASAVVMATPRYSDNPPPVYPSIARRRGYEGTVVLEVFVGEDGRVGELHIAESSSYRLLDRSAVKAVEGWQFEPGREDDKAVAMWVRVPVDFRLR
ncbi:TonB family protein [uncultured Desulfosarcina sp.]|uniref:energy transducer TonB n=1 Tax=uncultured Desulfosarcina sp. TaxID=218289 RepID=UPI0029C64626|nr:TonB family protein [uncultured Desulfosarcina sp.]